MTLVTQNFYYTDKDTAERLRRMENMLGTIISNQETFRMSFEEDMQAAKDAQAATNASLDETKAHLDAIKVDIQALKDQIANFPAAGLTPEQQALLAEIRDGAVALAAKAGSVASESADADAMNP
jgi:hypothetical protein